MRLQLSPAVLLTFSFLLRKVTSSFELTILHTNDVHSRFEPYTARDGRCTEQEAASKTGCFGGLARRATLIETFRKQHDNVVLLDAGDQYQGTPWFYYYKGKASSHFMNKLGYDAMSLGNHEFDNGIEGLIPFLKNITFPVVCANIDFEEEPEMENLVNRSTILEVAGQRIGVVGYLTQETPSLSDCGRLRFHDEVTSVQAEVDRLTKMGITKIIALGHGGFPVDKKIAEMVKGVDVVIGGHTNTFLYTGKPPSTQEPEGPYPLVVTQSDGQRSLVVQAYAYGKYLGHLQVAFDDAGHVKNWSGNPILLDKSIEQDPDLLEELDEWGHEVRTLYTSVVGYTEVFLDGTSGICRLEECLLGNLMTDAIVAFYRRNKKWPGLRIALFNGGGIRSSVETGNITYEDVLQVLPFGNGFDVIEIEGKDLLKVFEHSVTNYSRESRSGRFLQVSGLQVSYDLRRPNGERVQEVKVICEDCNDRRYDPLEKDTVYQLALPSYLVKGGDGFDILQRLWKQYYNLGDMDSDVFVNYLKLHSPVHPVLEGRITFSQDDKITSEIRSISKNSASSSTTATPLSIYLAALNFSISKLYTYLTQTRIFAYWLT